MFSILSIDFDYFPNPTKDDIKNYPDGIDLPSDITSIIWSSRYSCTPTLKNISINAKEIQNLKAILSMQRTNIPVLVAESHKDIYDFIHEHVSTDSRLHITHIDMHHDMFNDNPNVDCGNWLNFISKEYENLSVKWFTRPLSIEIYGLTQDIPYDDTGLESLRTKEYDAIFMCKSSTWTPPHLDKYFNYIFKEILNEFVNVDVTTDLKSQREDICLP